MYTHCFQLWTVWYRELMLTCVECKEKGVVYACGLESSFKEGHLLKRMSWYETLQKENFLMNKGGGK